MNGPAGSFGRWSSRRILRAASFGELYRSASVVRPGDGRSPRASLTTIYFLLRAGQHSRWHRVRSDEVWHFYEGDPIELLLADPA